MSHLKVWNFWAPRYKKLWVQKISLEPTRRQILNLLSTTFPNQQIGTYIDIGCGIGELVSEVESAFETQTSYGLDYSPEMIACAKVMPLKTTWFCEDIQTFQAPCAMDVILCTHSFPYYGDQTAVLRKMSQMLVPSGQVFIAFASKNTWYDALCLAIVKLTTGRAKYPSVKSFKTMAEAHFRCISTTRVKEKWFVPSIYVFQMERINE